MAFPLQRRSTSMTKTPYYKTLSKPQTFVWRMFLFVALSSFVAVILYNAILVAFNSNPALMLIHHKMQIALAGFMRLLYKIDLKALTD